MARNTNVSSISKARSIQEMAEFWDTHDATDFDDQTQEVEFSIDLRARRHYIAIDPALLVRLRELAASRGLSAGSLANLWLQERALTQDSHVETLERRNPTLRSGQAVQTLERSDV